MASESVNMRWEPQPRRSGRELFELDSMSNLNRLPVITLKPRILGRTDGQDLPWPLDDVCERLLVDGSLAAYNGQLLDRIIEVRTDLVTQEQGSYIRKFAPVNPKKPLGNWLIQDWKNYGTDNPELIETLASVSEETIWRFPNGRGLLYPVQDTYDVLESICIRIDEQMSGAALALVVLGFTGDWDQAKAELTSGPRIANFPGRNTRIERVGSTAVIDHLISEYALHFPNYQRLTHWLETSTGANTSGEAWRVRLEEMYYYVQLQQTSLKRIYKGVHSQDIDFANYQIRSADERTKDYALLQNMLANNVINDEEFTKAARQLMP